MKKNTSLLSYVFLYFKLRFNQNIFLSIKLMNNIYVFVYMYEQLEYM